MKYNLVWLVLHQEQVKHGDLTPDLRSYTESAIASIRVSKEGQEGLSAFLDKRKPQWLLT